MPRKNVIKWSKLRRRRRGKKKKQIFLSARWICKMRAIIGSRYKFQLKTTFFFFFISKLFMVSYWRAQTTHWETWRPVEDGGRRGKKLCWLAMKTTNLYFEHNETHQRVYVSNLINVCRTIWEWLFVNAIRRNKRLVHTLQDADLSKNFQLLCGDLDVLRFKSQEKFDF